MPPGVDICPLLEFMLALLLLFPNPPFMPLLLLLLLFPLENENPPGVPGAELLNIGLEAFPNENPDPLFDEFDPKLKDGVEENLNVLLLFPLFPVLPLFVPCIILPVDALNGLLPLEFPNAGLPLVFPNPVPRFEELPKAPLLLLAAPNGLPEVLLEAPKAGFPNPGPLLLAPKPFDVFAELPKVLPVLVF